MIQLYNKDYREVELPEKVDFVLVDIPYNLGVRAYASSRSWWAGGDFKNGKSEKAEAKMFDKDENFSIEELLDYIQRNLKEDSKALIFCSYEQQMEILANYKKYKFKKYTPLVFIKNSSAEVLKVNMRVVGACEYGLILYNGKLGTFNNKGKMIKNWMNFKRGVNNLHPTQKPEDLISDLIELFTNDGDLVLDCCMGSGTTGICCKKLNRNFIGIEIEEKYFNIAKERINEDTSL